MTEPRAIVSVIRLSSVPERRDDTWYADVEPEVTRKTRAWFYSRPWSWSSSVRGPDTFVPVMAQIYLNVTSAHRTASEDGKDACAIQHVCQRINPHEPICYGYGSFRCTLFELVRTMLTILHERACESGFSADLYAALPAEMLTEIQAHLNPSDILAWRLAHTSRKAACRFPTPPLSVAPFSKHPLWHGVRADTFMQLLVESDAVRIMQWCIWYDGQRDRVPLFTPRLTFVTAGAFASAGILRLLLRLRLWGLEYDRQYYNPSRSWADVVYGAVSTGRVLPDVDPCPLECIVSMPLLFREDPFCSHPKTPLSILIRAEAQGFVGRDLSTAERLAYWNGDIALRGITDRGDVRVVRSDIASACIIYGRVDLLVALLAASPSCGDIPWGHFVHLIETDVALRWLVVHWPQLLPSTLRQEAVTRAVVRDNHAVLNWLMERHYLNPTDETLLSRLEHFTHDDTDEPRLTWLMQAMKL